jgi:phospholipid/cholesterol/gamma-HCH transport system substrate-binding protein
VTRSLEIEVKVGIFVALGLALIMLTILMLGGGQALLSRGTQYHAKFVQTEGLIEGAIVKISGVKVGQVSQIKFLNDTGQVDVYFTVGSRYMNAIHQDAIAGIQTQGVLGDRYIVVSTGTHNTPVAPDGFELKTDAPKELKEFISDADEVLSRLKSSLASLDGILGSFRRENRAENFFRNITNFSSNASDGTKNLRDSMDHLKSIIAKVDRGEGTLGALVNDPSLYDDMKALLGGANRNRVLKYFIRKSVEESRDAAKKP